MDQRNTLNDFGHRIVELERLWIDRAICRDAVEKARQFVAESCCEWQAYFRRKRLRKSYSSFPSVD